MYAINILQGKQVYICIMLLHAGVKTIDVIFVLKEMLDFSLTVKVATLIFISRRGSAISSAKEGKSGFIHNLVKS